MTSELTIGRLADEAGVNVETIRYYQRRGLMAEPDKPASGHRRYGPAAIKRVRFIKRAQVLGFTLEEVASMLELDEACACAETRELAGHKLQVYSERSQSSSDLLCCQDGSAADGDSPATFSSARRFISRFARA
jgi:MerR family mercuric resistance operon transcriptional regulator